MHVRYFLLVAGMLFLMVLMASLSQAASIEIIQRGGPLFDKKQKKINAIIFISELKESLNEYRNKLNCQKWDDEIWDNFRRKMRYIIKHCENKY